MSTINDAPAPQVEQLALSEQLRALEILNETGALIASELDLDRIVQAVVDAGVELTGAQFGAFFYNVLRADGEAYMLYALSGAPRSAFDRFGMPRNTAVFHPTFAGEGVMRSDDITVDPRYGKSGPHFGMPEGHLPVRSYLAVPVIGRSAEVIGGLFFGHSEAARFTASAERVMRGIASQAAVAIDNARLYRALQDELATQVAERTAERDRMWRLSAELMLVADFEANILAVNPAWMNALGWSEDELVGRQFLALVHPEDVDATVAEVGRLADGVTTFKFENRYQHKDGGYRILSWTAVPEGGFIHAVARDVTQERHAEAALRRAEDALRQSQKMEAVGQLTGGVAHDFNNMLAIVIGSLDLAQRRLERNEAGAERYIQSAREGAQRAATLTQRLLAFSRQQPLQPRVFSPNRLVSSTSDMLQRMLGETIHLETVLAGGLWPVNADPHQLESALVNLAVNARDAMPGGGALTIETANAHLDDAYAREHLGVSAGQYVLIAVSDRGEGIAPEALERVFDPFFTTKPVGKGTGLGLSMVYGFIKQSGGHVSIYSEVGQGTTVKLYLPRHLGALEEASEPVFGPPPSASANEVVLVVEDDERVRAMSVEALKELGYMVYQAGGGEEALRVLDTLAKLDMVFTDIVMPGMTGRQLADKVLERWPEVKVLFTTGYTRNAVVHNGVVDPGVEFLPKPFSIAALAEKVRAVLDAPGRPHAS